MITTKQLIRSALTQIKTAPLNTALYISGVALAVTTVMVLSIIYHVKLSPIYPENNRDRMAYLQQVRATKKDGSGMSQYYMSHTLVKNWLSDLKSADAVAVISDSDQPATIMIPGQEILYNAVTKFTNPDFFKVYDYEFIAGVPFSPDDIAAGRNVAVLNQNKADELFGKAEASIGREIEVNFKSTKVIGVVKPGSAISANSFGEAFLPYTSIPGYDKDGDVGPYIAVFLIKPGKTIDDLKAEISERIRKSDSTIDVTHYIFNQPYTHYEQTFGSAYVDEDGNAKDAKTLGYYAIVALILLLVPAMNLSGLIIGGINRRSGEIAIRKSFGASRSGLLWQLMVENFILTLLGAIAGLFLSYIAVYFSRQWIFTISDSWVNAYDSVPELSPEMLLSPTLFAIVLIAALILNIASSLIPSWWTLRHPIVQSLNEKR